MQTRISEDFLQTPMGKRADKVIRTCVRHTKYWAMSLTHLEDEFI